MDEQSQLLSGAARGLILFLLATNLFSPVHGQTSAGSGQGASNGSSQAGTADQGGVDAGSLDKLLDLAEKDVGQLSQVNVAGHTGSPSLDQPVSTVERQESTVGQTPAAVFVITNEMIRRSGVTTIPDALRMVPGLEVARVTSNTWAISSRGFNMRFSDKLLVQIDGRSVYDNQFGGVYWDVQDVLLEDVERIEVIRGPGATIWGANAVNGVINIITKKAQDTQGVLMQAGVGTHDQGFTNARTGGRMGDDLYYRVYGKWFERGPGILDDMAATDDWRQARGGFRMDYNASASDAMTLQGDYYNGYSGDMTYFANPNPPFVTLDRNSVHVTGENILYRWKRTRDEDSDWTFQSYYDRTERHYPLSELGINRDTMDLDFQDRFPLGSRQDIIWGCEYRFTQDAIQNAPFSLSYNPDHRFDNLFSFFAQDQITLVQDRWFFTTGSKFEYNDYTNFEFQPTVRLLWTPTKRHSIWCAVSRAIRMPDRSSDNMQMRLPPVETDPLPVFPEIVGNPGVRSEELLAWELGARVQATERFSWDLALFYNQYDKLLGATPGEPYFESPAYMIQPYVFGNTSWGETYGAELAANYQVNEQWRLKTAYTYLAIFLHSLPDTLNFTIEGNNPINQLYLQSSWDLGRNLEFDLIGRYVDTLLVFPDPVPNYFVMDTRLAWHARKNLELSVVGRNLFNGTFYEYNSSVSELGLVGTKIGPEVYGQVTWRY
jgi:iron complex outermembrane receptor protein